MVREWEETDISPVVAAIEGYSLAYNLGNEPFDMQGVEDFYSKGETLMIAVPAEPGVIFRSWSHYSATWIKLLEDFSSFFFTPNGDLCVSRMGNIAWSSQTGQSHGKRKDGSEFRRNLRQTLVLAYEDGRWRIVQEHVSLAV